MKVNWKSWDTVSDWFGRTLTLKRLNLTFKNLTYSILAVIFVYLIYYYAGPELVAQSRSLIQSTDVEQKSVEKSVVSVILLVGLVILAIVAFIIILFMMMIAILKILPLQKRKIRVENSKTGSKPKDPSKPKDGDKSTDRDNSRWSEVLVFMKESPYLFPLYIVGGWFLVMGLLWIFGPKYFHYFRLNHPEVFWAIPAVILLANFLMIPKSWQMKFLAALCVLIALPYVVLAVADVVFNVKRDDIRTYWIEPSKKGRSSATEAVPKPTRYRVLWTKPPGVYGRNKEVQKLPHEGRVHEANGIFEWFAFYQQDNLPYTAHGIGSRTVGGFIEGKWSQPHPKEEGKWRLQETSPGTFFGSYTDGSLKGVWIPLLLEPIK